MATAGQKLGARPFMTTVPADDDYLYIVDDSETVTLQKSKRIKWSVLRGGISASAPVQSVFGRTGTVTALDSDYDDSQIDYNGSPTNFTATGTSVAIALDGIDNSLGNLQPLDGNLTDFAGLSPTSDEFIYTVTGAYVLGSFSPFARTLVDDTTAAAMRTTLGAQVTGSAGGGAVDSVFGRAGVVVAVQSDYDDFQIDYNGSPANFTATGTSVAIALDGIDNSLGNLQPLDGNLTDFAGLSPTSDEFIYTVTGAYVLGSFSPFARTVVDDTTAAAMRTTLGAQVTGSAGGGASLTVDTRTNILATASPSSGDMFYSTDSEEFFIHDGTDFQVAPLEHQATSTTPDIGLQPPMVFNDLGGYSDDYITHKYLYTVKIGESLLAEDNALRSNSGTLEFYANAAWNQIVMNFVFREDSGAGDTGNIYELEHQPVGLINYYSVMNGNSDRSALNDYPLYQQYSTDLGANQTPIRVKGRSFS